MKKNMVLLSTTVGISLILGVTAFGSAITKEQAKTAADAFAPADSTYIKTDVDSNVYEVKYFNTKNNEKYEIEISNETGKIVAFDSEKIYHADTTSVKITEDQAKKKITDEIANAEIISAVLEKDDDAEYNITFKTPTYFGEYSINPETGDILQREIKIGVPNTTKTSKTTITSNKAIELATKQIPDAIVTDLDLDWHNGIYCYELELYKDGMEYEIRVDAATGKIISNRSEIDDWSSYIKNDTNQKQGSQTAIGVQKAKQIALTKVPGAVIEECETDNNNGQLVYEINMYKDGWEYDLEINAITGAILEFDKEFEDD